ncbi:MAG TPA: family 1 encapsulin nanocompartment shell protein [Acidimicrobiales bacterium]|nr:family 1 encapsulin nanocompartment shell protein [Acidimicrobiales bacterium]
MNHLLRELAPLSDAAWKEVDEEAKARLGTYLAARRLVDFSGPQGWDHSAHNLGRTSAVADSPHADLRVRTRRVLPLVELRVPFSLARAELDDIERGAGGVDLGPLDEAAKVIALAENVAVFHGFAAGGIEGITQATSHGAIKVTGALDSYPTHVARAVQVLKEDGIGGPFGLALSSDVWTGVVETTEHGGYPLLEHLRRAIIGGPIVWAPGLEGAVVLSQRGGDFVFDCGQDLSIGYLGHDVDSVTLYLEESFTFKVVDEDAAVALGPA